MASPGVTPTKVWFAVKRHKDLKDLTDRDLRDLAFATKCRVYHALLADVLPATRLPEFLQEKARPPASATPAQRRAHGDAREKVFHRLVHKELRELSVPFGTTPASLQSDRGENYRAFQFLIDKAKAKQGEAAPRARPASSPPAAPAPAGPSKPRTPPAAESEGPQFLGGMDIRDSASPAGATSATSATSAPKLAALQRKLGAAEQRYEDLLGAHRELATGVKQASTDARRMAMLTAQNQQLRRQVARLSDARDAEGSLLEELAGALRRILEDDGAASREELHARLKAAQHRIAQAQKLRQLAGEQGDMSDRMDRWCEALEARGHLARPESGGGGWRSDFTGLDLISRN